MWIESTDADGNNLYARDFDGKVYIISQRLKNGRVIWQATLNGVNHNWADNLDTVKSYIENIYKKPVKVGDRVERKWGFYEILAIGEGFLVKRLVFNPGMAISYQFHKFRSECWKIIKGDGVFKTERFSPVINYFGSYAACGLPKIEVNESKNVGNVIEIKTSQKHKFTAGDFGAEIIEIWSGSKLDEDDIIRIEEV